MTQDQAIAVANALDGNAIHSGGNLWVVRFDRDDGSLAVIDDEGICEYDDQSAYDIGDATVILFRFA